MNPAKRRSTWISWRSCANQRCRLAVLACSRGRSAHSRHGRRRADRTAAGLRQRPMHGCPPATSTHTFPRRLHPRHNCPTAVAGGRSAARSTARGAVRGRSDSRAARRRPARARRPVCSSPIRRTRARGRRLRASSVHRPSCAGPMPPAVAHAPMVTSSWVRDLRCTISSACCVLTEPSTRRTS